MIDELSIVETDKMNHTVETDMMKLVVEIEYFSMSFDVFDKETRSSDGLQPKQGELNCVHALNEPHLHEIHVVPNKHEVDRCGRLSAPERIALSARVAIDKLKTANSGVANSGDTKKTANSGVANSGVANSATTEIANSDIANSLNNKMLYLNTNSAQQKLLIRELRIRNTGKC
ncbi:hypothetical protein Tco_0567223 [Tanacetum coccineum]